jgi:hypothetical protein
MIGEDVLPMPVSCSSRNCELAMNLKCVSHWESKRFAPRVITVEFGWGGVECKAH